MSFFDGKHKTTPKINLSGSSRQVNIEQFILILHKNSYKVVKTKPSPTLKKIPY